MADLPINQIILGDCVEVLPGFPDNSIDLGVTDPPYGLKFMGVDWDKALPPKEAFRQLLRVLKPGAIAFVNSSPRQDLFWRMCALLEGVGFKLDQSFMGWIYKTGFPKGYDVAKGIETMKYPDGVALRNLFDEGTAIDNLPYTLESRQWTGWKNISGLKPALEPIIVAMKPLSESTIVDNVLEWGTGAINVDATRIPFQNEGYSYKAPKGSLFDGEIYGKGDDKGFLNKPYESHQMGRYPANLLVSDDALDDGEITQSGRFEPHHEIKDEGGYNVKNVYGKYRHLSASEQVSYGDRGTKSRYFDLDAWFEHHGIFDVPKPSPSERNFGLKGKNKHPTVKPLQLVSYLIELGCPKNGVVLDPFVGSGTTCIASKRLCRKYIGIEKNEKYYRQALERVSAYPVPLDWLFTEGVN